MQPWEYGAQILLDFAFSAVATVVYAAVRRFRGESWGKAFLSAAKTLFLVFASSAVGILARMGRHHVLALPAVRYFCIVGAVVLWALVVYRIFQSVSRTLGSSPEKPARDGSTQTSSVADYLTPDRATTAFLFSAVVFTTIAIFS